MLKEASLKKKEDKWEKEKSLLAREQELKKDKQSFKTKKFTTTKMIMFFLFLNCTILEIFTGWVTVQSLQVAAITDMTPDLSPLTSLIGIVVSEVMGFAVYAVKSMKENTEGGITHMLAKHELEQQLETNDEEIMG
jgi:hypothetical protein